MTSLEIETRSGPPDGPANAGERALLRRIYEITLLSRAVEERFWVLARQGLASFVLTPRGHDVAQIASGAAYPLYGVIGAWDDEHALAILTNGRRAMGQRGTLLLVERVLPAAGALASPDSHERTEAEYRALLAATGFTLSRVIPVGGGYSIVVGLPIKGTH